MRMSAYMYVILCLFVRMRACVCARYARAYALIHEQAAHCVSDVFAALGALVGSVGVDGRVKPRELLVRSIRAASAKE